MKTKVLFWINNYKREKELKELVNQISETLGDYEITVLIISDGSPPLNFRFNSVIVKTDFIKKHQGKKGYYNVVNLGLEHIKSLSFDYCIKIDDDMTLTEGFLDKTLKIWNGIPDKKKISMDILSSRKQRGRNLLGTQAYPISIDDKYRVFKIDWVDMNFICERKFFELLDWKIPKVTSNANSSCVGLKITRLLSKKNVSFWQSETPLIIHGEHESLMHPEHRKSNPL